MQKSHRVKDSRESETKVKISNLNSKFFQKVYAVVRKIPEGKVATYGQIAGILGTKDARKVGPRTELTSRRNLPGSRSRGAFIRGKWAISPHIVGFALHANRNPNIPCHRVVNKDGKVALNYSFGDWKEQKMRLIAEGVKFKNEMHVDLSKFLWRES